MTTPSSPTTRRIRALLACVVMLLPFAASAQPRTFTDPTLLGTLEIGQFPLARLDDRDVRLAPGVRIRTPDNLIALPGSVSGKVPVRYRLDTMGQVIEAWILTEEELRIAKAEAKARARSNR